MSAAKQFQEKLTILNTEFVDFISGAVQENPAYDLSPSLKDYIDHVQELDKIYSEQKVGERKIITAVRRNGQDSSAPKPAVPKEPKVTPAPAPPKDVGNGTVEPAGQFSALPKITMPKMPEVKAPSFSAPKLVASSTTSSNASTCGSTNRKRRQQEALDYDEMLSAKSEDYGKSKPTETAPSKLPDEWVAFKAKLQAEKEQGSKPADKPGSSLASLLGASDDKPAPKSSLFTSPPKAAASPAGLFTFGAKKDDSAASDSAPKPSLPLFGSGDAAKNSLSVPKPFAFEGRPTLSPASSEKPSEGLFSFGAKPADTFKPAAAPASLFGSSSSATDAKAAAFAPLTFGAKKDDSATTTAPSSLFTLKPPALGGSLNPLLGGPKPLAPATGGSLFANLVNPPAPAPAAEGEADGDDLPPPKPEAVEHEEKDAVYHTKCSMFTFSDGEYKKTGVGQFFIKPNEKGANLLIRAATTIGTVWVNTYIDDNFKANKKSKDKIQASFPTPDGIKTVLIRVPEVEMKSVEGYLTGEKKP